MLRMLGPLSTALAVALVLPAALPDAVDPVDPADTRGLDRLRADLARLQRIEPELQAAAAAHVAVPAVSMASLLDLTEPGASDGRAQELELAELRGEVAQLQEALDERLAARKSAPAASTEMPRARTWEDYGLPLARSVASEAAAANAEHAAAAAPPRSEAAHAAAVPGTDGSHGSPGLTDTTGAASYSADPERQGQALLKAGRPAEALAIFETLPRAPSALYWSGRARERLSQPLEAVRDFEQVLALDPSGMWAELARLDLDFVRWRARFDGLELPDAPAEAAAARAGAAPAPANAKQAGGHP
jgi:tetratricopeptide (TPR) repeat protein